MGVNRLRINSAPRCVVGPSTSNDEQGLIGHQQAELAPRQILDRRGIVAQTTRHIAEARILGAGFLQLSLDLFDILPCLHGGEHSLIADQRVHEDHAPEEDECRVDQPPAPARRASRISQECGMLFHCDAMRE